MSSHMTTTDTSAAPHVLDAHTFPLHGSRLIEASAGTGKTWTIAALYVRLVLGHRPSAAADDASDQGAIGPLLPPDILVMTFTRAATRELSERIRARLVQAVACFRGETEGDPFLQTLLADYPDALAREQAAWRLALAAEGMDDAAIFTIDAWCQRVLREHALDSGCLFDETLEPDEGERLREAVYDYWRQQCYPLPAELLDIVLAQWNSVDALLEDMQALRQAQLPGSQTNAASNSSQLATLLPQWQSDEQQQLQQLAQGWEKGAQDYLSWIEGELEDNKSAWDGRKLQFKRCQDWLAALEKWAKAPNLQLRDALKTGATRLIPSGLDEARKGGVSVQYPPQAQALENLLQALDAIQPMGLRLRWHAQQHVTQRLQWLKSEAGTFGFADMLQRLDTALAGPQGTLLRQRLRQQYPVALLDEFQDTSPLQYRLFEHIYQPDTPAPDCALLLIGDPKQSIYGFRGADIYSYLKARKATTGRHYVLSTNYRSTPALVAATNHWFALAEQRHPQAAFLFRESSRYNPLPFLEAKAHGRSEALCAAGQPLPAMQIYWHHGFDDDGAPCALNKDTLMHTYAQACAERIVGWLNDASMGFQTADGALARLRPRDIAVLVRSGREAQAVRHQLQRRGVTSVYLSERSSVFESPQAQDLLYWLKAVAEPLNARAVRAALATRLLALPLPELQRLAQDDELLDAYTLLLRELHLLWQRQGVLAMLRASLHRLKLPARWLAEAHSSEGERALTNYLHLAELLQNASAALEGEQALIRWLAQHIANPSQDSEAQTLRLESDADLVQIVTIHKSKGLEYPIVMLPFGSSFTKKDRKNTAWVRLRDGTLRLDFSADELAEADKERLREDLRLFYVALTRARHLVWLGLGALRHGNSDKCVNEHGASGYLLGDLQSRGVQEWEKTLEQFAQGCSDIQLQPLHTLGLPVACTRLQPHTAPPALTAPTHYDGQFDRTWGVASFSALTRAMPIASDSLILSTGQAEDEVLPTDTDTNAATSGSAAVRRRASAAVWHQFHRGPLVGNFLHDQLQWLGEAGFVLDALQQERLHRRCLRAGYSEEAANDVVQWLGAVVQHTLPVLDARLPDIDTVLPEMEFWMPLAQLPAAQVDALCRADILPGMERPALPQRQLHGMLMGFADLVFAHQGRYWVLDYKSNHLGPDASAYAAPALQHAMLAHRYDVQAALYLLALHRLLHARLGDAYQPEEQLGGALYFFLRGIDGDAGGIHPMQAPLPLLDALHALASTTSASSSTSTDASTAPTSLPTAEVV